MTMELGARDAANTYFQLRDRGAKDQPAFDEALHVYCRHFPNTNYVVASPLVAQIIAEVCCERGKVFQRSAPAY